jgi:HEAT repeat protein
MSIESLALPSALSLLFGADAGLVYVYRPDPGGAATLEELRVTLGRSAGLLGVTDPMSDAHERGRPLPAPAATPSSNNNPAVASAGGPSAVTASDPDTRRDALEAIVDRGDGSGVEEVRLALATDVDVDIRTQAVSALARIATPTALEALRQGLADPEVAVRLGTVDAIATFETGRARALLREALRDRNEQVRDVARAALDSFQRVDR